MEHYRTQIEDIAKKICQEMNVAIYDIEEKLSLKGRIVIVYLTKIGGITLDECARFSRKLGNEFEVLDIIPERYFLEVSSPGLERPLRLKSHYKSAISEKVAVEWQNEQMKQSNMGTLLEVNPDHIVLDDRGKLIQIPFSAIGRAKTIYLPAPKGREKDEC